MNNQDNSNLAMGFSKDQIAHDIELQRIIRDLQNKGFDVQETEYRHNYSGEELRRIQYTFDDLHILEIRSFPDILVTNEKKGIRFRADVKLGHALEAFQLAFNIKRMQEGEKMLYFVVDLNTKRTRVLPLTLEIFGQLRQLIYYHPERPYFLDFLKEKLEIQMVKALPLGHNVGNGRSQDPCVFPKDWVWDEMPEFESYILSLAIGLVKLTP